MLMQRKVLLRNSRDTFPSVLFGIYGVAGALHHVFTTQTHTLRERKGMTTLTPRQKSTAINVCRMKAMRQLAKTYRAEYLKLYEGFCKEAGLDIKHHSKSKLATLRKKQERINKLKAEVKHLEALLENKNQPAKSERELFELWKQSVSSM